MTPAERSAHLASAKARAAGPLATFQCPRQTYAYRLTPRTCGELWQRRKGAAPGSEYRITLDHCAGCPVGEANAGHRDRAGSVLEAVRAAPGLQAAVYARRLGLPLRQVKTELLALQKAGKVTSRSTSRAQVEIWGVV